MVQDMSCYPQNIVIETTTRCNLRCKQCARLVDKYALADMEMETFRRISPLFPHIKEAALYGHGETFLYSHFFEMLEELKKHDVFVYVTTNGTLITEKAAERLVELKLDRLSFSLDAADPELFNEIRRGANFDKVIRNIRRLNTMKKREGRDDKPILSIMFCALKSNIQDLPKLVLLADELNMLHGISVLSIVEYDSMVGESLLRYPELAEKYFNEANFLAVKHAIPLELPLGQFEFSLAPVEVTLGDRMYRTYREFQRSSDKSSLFKIKLSRLTQRIKTSLRNQNGHPVPQQAPDPKTIRVKKCRDPWDFMFINVHGEVRVCCASHRIMGNIYEDDILAIWDNEAYREFRKRILTEDAPEECNTCVMRGWHEIPTR